MEKGTAMQCFSLPGFAVVSVLVLGGCDSLMLPEAACENPAPLLGQKNPQAPGYIVVYEQNTPAESTTQQLAEKYSFTPKHIYHALSGFSATLTDDALAGLRCESVVKYVEHDSVVKAGHGS